MNNILNIDFWYVDNILSTEADYYSIPDKADTEDGVENGVRLCLAAQNKNKPIWSVFCDDGCNYFTAYFIGDLSDISQMLQKKLKEAKAHTND